MWGTIKPHSIIKTVRVSRVHYMALAHALSVRSVDTCNTISFEYFDVSFPRMTYEVFIYF